jgi:hypothetical protein
MSPEADPGISPFQYFNSRENAEVGLAARPDQHALRGDRNPGELGHQLHDAF